MTVYVLHTTICHIMYRFWCIGQIDNKSSKWTFMTLIESTPLQFWQNHWDHHWETTWCNTATWWAVLQYYWLIYRNMWKFTKSDLSHLENYIYSDSIKSVYSQFISTILGKLYVKIEKMSLHRCWTKWTMCVKMGEYGQMYTFPALKNYV